jgi:hypothetical protein
LIEDQVILVECIWPVMHLTLSRPEVLNALNSDSHFLLVETFELNYKENATMISSYDTREGSKAFLEKRTPLWQGR